ncbi:hypothetical protein BIY37_06325 [Candidatus Brocadia sapporoensis]|uniref:Uncharacterized protein n=1 Tax=Candidatus Brocadia sapporoensis TaxID=392547 RepID=A0A1V6M0H1_9BACT|nr:hypothetical protein BIY37_06325 [Candidatus Brocadia sapporoensis]
MQITFLFQDDSRKYVKMLKAKSFIVKPSFWQGDEIIEEVVSCKEILTVESCEPCIASFS